MGEGENIRDIFFKSLSHNPYIKSPEEEGF